VCMLLLVAVKWRTLAFRRCVELFFYASGTMIMSALLQGHEGCRGSSPLVCGRHGGSVNGS
jgi:hypothetical protein